MRCLVTGAAGFIGFHLALRLLEDGHVVAGVDCLSEYYDVELKHARAAVLDAYPNYSGYSVSLEDRTAFEAVWREASPEIVLHLAAQPGVRYSIDFPDSYIAANIVGTFNLLEVARHSPPQHLLLASTSSIYGGNIEMPFRENDPANHPLSLYAATKGATELMAHSYAHLFGTPTTAFRFFTVYGPWGRPDMALFKFARKITAGEPIELYNQGAMSRDFTFIDDLVEAVIRLIDVPPPACGGERSRVEGDSLSPAAPFRTVNIGSGQPEPLMAYVAELEKAMGREADKIFLPMQDGEVPATFASADLLERLTGYRPSTPISAGVPAFVNWYRHHYDLN